jgi:hypothetical protein
VTFLEPLALFGLAAAGLPALLHLLQRRQPQTVVFPAVRYLTETEERHSRRLKLRNLLLLLLRTLLIAAIVLAAARPVVSLPVGGAHAPSALVLVVDNSLSSAAVSGGRRVLDALRDPARDVVAAVTPGDRLWLVLADGIPRASDRAAALDLIARVEPEPVRLDLGDAVRTAARVLAAQPLPGTVVLLSDLQASAFGPGDPVATRVVALVPPPAPDNRGVDSARVEPAVWSPGGRVEVTVGGSAGPPAEVQLVVDGRMLARDLAAPGDAVVLPVEGVTPGWHAAEVLLAPDELRLDDARWLAIRSAPPAAVTADRGAGDFVAAALDVLETGGRVRAGPGGPGAPRVTLSDRPAPGRTVVFPPADPALVGAVNRALAARGVSTRFGDLLTGEWALTGELDGAAGATVRRRYRLSGGGRAIERAGGEPWLVHEGDYVIVASRLEEPWTALPVSPGFVPFLDALVNRVAAAEAWRAAATPGAVVALPAGATSLLLPNGPIPLPDGDRVEAPAVPGVYYALDAAGDTVGALEVNPDPRESDLTPASRAALRRTLGSGADLVGQAALTRRAFAAGRRAEAATPLLGLALLLALAEWLLASRGSGRVRDER